MKLKNHNPATGIRQAISGSVKIPRSLFLFLTYSHKLTPTQFGYFIIFLCAVDWDRDKFRYGTIRAPLRTLAKLWNVSYSSLSAHKRIFIGQGILVEDSEMLRLPLFDAVTFTGADIATRRIKNAVDESIIGAIASYIQQDQYENRSLDQAKIERFFSTVFREPIKVNSVRIHQESTKEASVNIADEIPF